VKSARGTGEAGFTLIEVLVALSIFTAAVGTLVAALGTSAQASDRHRKEATAETIVRAYAEAVEGATYKSVCATAVSSYGAAFTAPVPTGYAVAPPVVRDLSGGVCTAGMSLQRVTLTVSTADGRASAAIDVVKYKP
jgi:prepilin-type N-terminal cleavage/methylation domain-containing protein